MDFKKAVETCHVRSGIRRKSNPSMIYWKNHPIPIRDRVPSIDRIANDWEEYDPREHDECSAFNEMPA